ncbi:MAG: hypothetical protein ACOY3P_07045 [Planctomycetota bacterium]
MALVYIKEIHDGRDGEESASKRQTIRRYTRVWRARTDDAYDEATVVLAGMPAIGARYPYDLAARLTSLSPKQDAKSKFVWTVTGQYSTEREMEENPLDEPPDYEWNTDSFSRPFFFDRDGDAILNSAKDPYLDPPVEGDDSRWVCTVSRNLATVPSWLLDYRDAVNSDAFTLDGIPVAAGKAKITSIRIGKRQVRNEIAYRVVQLSISLRHEGWAWEGVDSGFRTYQSGEWEEITDKNGKKITQPALLDGSGDVLASPTPQNAVKITADLYRERAFAPIV